MKPQRTGAPIPLQPPGGGATPATRPGGQPRDYVLWSLLNVLLGYGLGYLGCLCFPALIYSIKARDCKVLGDLEGAQRHGGRAKVCNIICSLLIVLTVVVVICAIIAAVKSTTT